MKWESSLLMGESLGIADIAGGLRSPTKHPPSSSAPPVWTHPRHRPTQDHGIFRFHHQRLCERAVQSIHGPAADPDRAGFLHTHNHGRSSDLGLRLPLCAGPASAWPHRRFLWQDSGAEDVPLAAGLLHGRLHLRPHLRNSAGLPPVGRRGRWRHHAGGHGVDWRQISPRHPPARHRAISHGGPDRHDPGRKPGGHHGHDAGLAQLSLFHRHLRLRRGHRRHSIAA